MQTERDNFVEFLNHIKKSTGDNYMQSTIEAYSSSIDLLTIDLNNYLGLNIQSLYDINDTDLLNQYFTELFSIPSVIKAEKIQRKRKTNGFKRYIEFREYEQEIDFESKQKESKEVQESRTEGGEKIVVSRVAERDSRLRKAAIIIHGLMCAACGFDFERKYGRLGERFIEIHHIKKLRNGEEFSIVNTSPENDLIPLCSNCHRMVHRKRNVVLSITELKETIRKTSTNTVLTSHGTKSC